MEKLKQKRGITLVALIITVIVLLILAGITINLTIGEEGIIKRAQEAGKNYTNAVDYERNELVGFVNETDKIIENVTSAVNGEYTEPIEYNDMNKWISLAGITKNIISLEELNGDEIEKLMTSKEAIEYMINSKQELLEKIVSSSDMVANLGKYKEVRAKVLSDQFWRNEIENSDYIDVFFENCEYNSQDGIAEATLNPSAAINAFKGGGWGSFPYNTESAGQYIQFNFTTENTIYRLQFKSFVGASSTQLGATSFDIVVKLKGSNDGENFVDITEELLITPKTTNYETIDSIFYINTDKKYSKYRLELVSGGYQGKYLAVYNKCNFGIADIRLYTY